MRTQGVWPTRLRGHETVMSRLNMGHALGNAMSGNVLDRLIPRALFAAGLLPSPPCDFWARPDFTPFPNQNRVRDSDGTCRVPQHI